MNLDSKKIKILIKDVDSIYQVFPQLRMTSLDFVYTEDPDYIIYNNSAKDSFLKYQGIRIYLDVEAYHPDFNVCDYALSNDIMDFGDRYCRYPQISYYPEEIELLEKRSNINIDISHKTHFCNFIYSNANAHPMREHLFHEISKYKKIDSGGRFLNNLGYIIGGGIGDYSEKLDFQSKCKFSLIVENVSLPGHTSEKILHAFLSNTIPIYFGDPCIGAVFNENAFVNAHQYENIEQMIETIKMIDESETLFKSMLNEPVFNEDIQFSKVNNDVLLFLKNIFEQDLKKAYRRNDMMQAKSHEIRLKYGWGIYRKRATIESRGNKILKALGLGNLKRVYIKKFYKQVRN